MKQLNLIRISVLVAIVALLAACGGGEKTPKQIETSIWDHIQKGQYEKAIDIWYENSITDEKTNADEQKEFAKAFAEKMKASIEEKGGIDDVQIVSEEISEDGNTAVVNVLITFKDGTTQNDDSKYTKVDGQWKMSNSK